MGINEMRNHLMISESDGALYDTRAENWSEKPLRANYARHHRNIQTVADMKATLRAGAYAWPGGYELFFITSDGAAICFNCARENFALIADSIRNDICDGWKVIGCDIAEYYDESLYCDHCSRQINV
jgi:hypothetical protein